MKCIAHQATHHSADQCDDGERGHKRPIEMLEAPASRC
jgi:hypothetical protein